MLSIPIKAVCKAPKVKVSPEEELNFGKVFLDYPEMHYI